MIRRLSPKPEIVRRPAADHIVAAFAELGRFLDQGVAGGRAPPGRVAGSAKSEKTRSTGARTGDSVYGYWRRLDFWSISRLFPRPSVETTVRIVPGAVAS
jgi:hypothetical protein